MPRLIAFALLAVAACGDYKLEPLPLQIGLEASRLTSAPGDTINFLAIAQGGSLLNVTIDFGDGTNDLFSTGGARTARITFKHAFDSTGTFQVEATVIDAAAGAKTATIQVAIN
jgi:hypothetical protein